LDSLVAKVKEGLGRLGACPEGSHGAPAAAHGLSYWPRQISRRHYGRQKWIVTVLIDSRRPRGVTGADECHEVPTARPPVSYKASQAALRASM
jgi:hypothetical protein